MEELVSIIVPVYNVQKYLRYSINSVLKQTYKNIEILLIDDGSKDNSPAICDEFARKYANVFVYHNENHGVSYSRNFGIEKANGKYVCFVDGDDWMEDTAVEKMINSMNDNKSDLVIGSITEVWPHTNVKISYNNKLFRNGHEGLEFIYSIYVSCWGKLYKKEIINNNILFFDADVKNGEDTIFLHDYLSICDSFSTIDNNVYYYNKLETNTAVSRKYNDFGNWRIKEYKSRIAAYSKWSDDDYILNSLIEQRNIEYLADLLEHYLDGFVHNKEGFEVFKNSWNYFKEGIKKCTRDNLKISNIDFEFIDKNIKNDKFDCLVEMYKTSNNKSMLYNILYNVFNKLKKPMGTLKTKILFRKLQK